MNPTIADVLESAVALGLAPADELRAMLTERGVEIDTWPELCERHRKDREYMIAHPEVGEWSGEQCAVYGPGRWEKPHTTVSSLDAVDELLWALGCRELELSGRYFDRSIGFDATKQVGLEAFERAKRGKAPREESWREMLQADIDGGLPLRPAHHALGLIDSGKPLDEVADSFAQGLLVPLLVAFATGLEVAVRCLRERRLPSTREEVEAFSKLSPAYKGPMLALLRFTVGECRDEEDLLPAIVECAPIAYRLTSTELNEREYASSPEYVAAAAAWGEGAC